LPRRRGETQAPGHGHQYVLPQLADLGRHFPKADPRRSIVAWRRGDWATNPLTCGAYTFVRPAARVRAFSAGGGGAKGGYTFVRPGGTGARARLAAADTGALFWAGPRHRHIAHRRVGRGCVSKWAARRRRNAALLGNRTEL